MEQKNNKKISRIVIFIVLCVVIVAGYFFYDTKSRENSNYESTTAMYTFIDIGSKGCQPCEELKPIIKNLRNRYSDKINVNYYDIYTKKGSEISKKYNITGTPTLIFLNENGEEVKRLIGYHTENTLESTFRVLGWIE